MCMWVYVYVYLWVGTYSVWVCIHTYMHYICILWFFSWSRRKYLLCSSSQKIFAHSCSMWLWTKRQVIHFDTATIQWQTILKMWFYTGFDWWFPKVTILHEFCSCIDLYEIAGPWSLEHLACSFFPYVTWQEIHINWGHQSMAPSIKLKKSLTWLPRANPFWMDSKS